MAISQLISYLIQTYMCDNMYNYYMTLCPCGQLTCTIIDFIWSPEGQDGCTLYNMPALYKAVADRQIF